MIWHSVKKLQLKLFVYDKYNKNKKLSVPEYAEKLLENFKKTDALDYDGGELK